MSKKAASKPPVDYNELEQIRENWKFGGDKKTTNMLPVVRMVTHETAKPIRVYLSRYIKVLIKFYSMKPDAKKKSFDDIKQDIELMIHDSMKIGFEFGSFSDEHGEPLAYERAVDYGSHLLAIARYELTQSGLRLIKAAVSKKLIANKDPKILIREWDRLVQKYQLKAFSFGFSFEGE